MVVAVDLRPLAACATPVAQGPLLLNCHFIREAALALLVHLTRAPSAVLLHSAAPIAQANFTVTVDVLVTVALMTPRFTTAAVLRLVAVRTASPDETVPLDVLVVVALMASLGTAAAVL